MIVAPIGFVFDHMEVVWDLDMEARRLAEELGMTMVRMPTPARDPRFAAMVRELVLERQGMLALERLGTLPEGPACGSAECCRYEARRGG